VIFKAEPIFQFHGLAGQHLAEAAEGAADPFPRPDVAGKRKRMRRSHQGAGRWRGRASRTILVTGKVIKQLHVADFIAASTRPAGEFAGQDGRLGKDLLDRCGRVVIELEIILIRSREVFFAIIFIADFESQMIQHVLRIDGLDLPTNRTNKIAPFLPIAWRLGPTIRAGF